MNLLDHPIITSTQLRTHSKQLMATLKKGKVVHLIHRSQIVGIIYPTSKVFSQTKSGTKKNSLPKIENIE